MADYDASAVEALLAAAEDSEHELVKHLRGVAAGKFEAASQPNPVSEADMKELAGYRRAALFDEAGIGNSSNEEKLFRQALANTEGLTVDSIKAEAAKYGLSESAPEPNPATPEEMAGHQTMVDLNGEAPAPPPDIEARMASAKSPEELDALVAEAGLQWVGNQAADLLNQ